METACGQGDASAQAQLGFMYFLDNGVSQDYVQASKWCYRAAQQGKAMGQNVLGAIYSIWGRKKESVIVWLWNRKIAQLSSTSLPCTGMARVSFKIMFKHTCA
jgi:TPR repeat protein